MMLSSVAFQEYITVKEIKMLELETFVYVSEYCAIRT